MSVSTLWKVYKTTARTIQEYRNGFGTGPAMWSLMVKEYIGAEEHEWHKKEIGDKLWPLYKRKDIPKHRRFGLLFTFDRSVIRPCDIKESAEMCRKVHEDILKNTSWKWSHFESISQTLDALRVDKRCLGVALGCTSVCDPWEGYKGAEINFIHDGLEEAK